MGEARPASGLFGWVLALLALVGQLALGAMLPPDEARTEVATLAVLCRADMPPAPHGEQRHHRHVAAWALCPVAVASAILLASCPLLPLAAVGTVLRRHAPQAARAPPSHASHLGFPRGPPIPA